MDFRVADQVRQIVRSRGYNRDVEDYILGSAMAESSGRLDARPPNAAAHGLSVSGLLQFTDDTYRDMVASIRRRSPSIASEMLRQGKNSLFSQVHAGLEYMQQNADALQANGIPVTAVNLQITHFAGTTGGPRILRHPDNTPLVSVMGADSYNANKTFIDRVRTVGGLKRYYANKMNDDLDLSFANPLLNPAGAERFVLASFAANGRQAEAESIRGQLDSRDSQTRREGLTALRSLNEQLLVESGTVANAGQITTPMMHLSQKFGAPSVARLQRADPNIPIAQLGISGEAYAAYQAESRTEMRRYANGHQSVGVLLDKPYELMTAGDLRQMGESRVTAYDQEMARRRQRGGGVLQEAGNALQNFFRRLTRGQVGLGDIVLLIAGLLGGGMALKAIGGAVGGSRLGHIFADATPVTETAPSTAVASAESLERLAGSSGVNLAALTVGEGNGERVSQGQVIAAQATRQQDRVPGTDVARA